MKTSDLIYCETDDSCAICGKKGIDVLSEHHIDSNKSNNEYHESGSGLDMGQKGGIKPALGTFSYNSPQTGGITDECLSQKISLAK